MENGGVKTKEVVIEIPDWKEIDYLSPSSRHYTRQEEEEIQGFFDNIFMVRPNLFKKDKLCFRKNPDVDDETTKYVMLSYSNDAQAFKDKLIEMFEADIINLKTRIEIKQKALTVLLD